MECPPDRSEGVVQTLAKLRVRAELGLLVRPVPPEDRVWEDLPYISISNGRGFSADSKDPSEPPPDDGSVQQPEETVLMQQEEQGAEGPVVRCHHLPLQSIRPEAGVSKGHDSIPRT